MSIPVSTPRPTMNSSAMTSTGTRMTSSEGRDPVGWNGFAVRREHVDRREAEEEASETGDVRDDGAPARRRRHVGGPEHRLDDEPGDDHHDDRHFDSRDPERDHRERKHADAPVEAQ